MIALLASRDARLLARAAEVLERAHFSVFAADHVRDALEFADALPALALLLWTPELRDGPAAETAALIADRWPEAAVIVVLDTEAAAAAGAALHAVTNLRLCAPATMSWVLREWTASHEPRTSGTP